jgi:predicted hotdog family 3-hydroxylacyl-ACP dehydratase
MTKTFNMNSSGIPSLPCPAENLIIHRGPMLLIDELLERQHSHAVASSTLDKGNICITKKFGVLPEYFIEVLAQTVAAASGYDRLIAEAPPGSGFLVGVENFTCEDFTSAPAKPQKFITRILTTMEAGAMKIVHGEVFAGDISVATAELKLWLE